MSAESLYSPRVGIGFARRIWRKPLCPVTMQPGNLAIIDPDRSGELLLMPVISVGRDRVGTDQPISGRPIRRRRVQQGLFTQDYPDGENDQIHGKRGDAGNPGSANRCCGRFWCVE